MLSPHSLAWKDTTILPTLLLSWVVAGAFLDITAQRTHHTQSKRHRVHLLVTMEVQLLEVCASQVRFHHNPDKRDAPRVLLDTHVSTMEHMCLVFVDREHIDLKQIQYNASHVLRKRTLLRVV